MEVAARARNIIGATPLEPPVIDTEAEEPDAEAVMEETDGQRQRPRKEEPNPFDVFDSAAAIYAFVHMQFGADGLREMLAIGDTDRETPMQDASVLHQMDLPRLPRS